MCVCMCVCVYICVCVGFVNIFIFWKFCDPISLPYILQALKDHPSRAFLPARAASDTSFSIVHYAGTVCSVKDLVTFVFYS